MTDIVDTDSTPQRARFGRGTLLKGMVAVVAVVAVLVWAVLWFYRGLTHVTENDAQVATDEITVSSRLPGRVTEFDLIRGARLETDTPVAQLYSRPDELRLAELQARVDRIQAQLDGQTERIALAEKQIQGGLEQSRETLQADIAAADAAKASMQQARMNADRSEKLFQRHSVSQSQRDIDRYTFRATRGDYQHARRKVNIDRTALEYAHTGMLSSPPMTLPNPDVLRDQRAVTRRRLAEARAALERQRNRLNDLSVTSPVNGVVDQTFIQKGEYVSAGQPIAMMHEPDNIWIEARVKETKIGSLRAGQPVTITVDAHPDTPYHGHVQVVGHAATNQFALLPNPNPSGNFTKITQRIPVRIAIDRGRRAALSPGMMVEVDIDISDAGEADRARNPQTSANH